MPGAKLHIGSCTKRSSCAESLKLPDTAVGFCALKCRNAVFFTHSCKTLMQHSSEKHPFSLWLQRCYRTRSHG